MCLLICCCGLLAAGAVSTAPNSAQVAVVLLRAPDGYVDLNVAYPPGTTEEEVLRDVQAISQWSSWEFSQPSVVVDDSGTTASFRLVDAPPGAQLTPWPFIAALARFEDIVVAYVGPTAPGQGQLENRFVTVEWNAFSTGITYRVKVRRGGFSNLEELASPEPRALTEHLARTPWSAIAKVLVLAIAAGIVAYSISWRVIHSPMSKQVAEEETNGD
jgi:hypothetical protein